MKNKVKLSTVLIFTVALVAFACSNAETSKNVSDPTNSTIIANTSGDKQTYKAIGVIKKIDPESGKVTIDHEDIPGYMAAMEMNERVGDKSLLNNLKAGDKVDFEIERTGSKIVVTKINKIGEVAFVTGTDIFRANCASCHGERGEGAPKGISLVKGHALDHTEADFIKTVTSGKDNGNENKMPAFKDKLSTEQIAEVVRFVRNDIQKDAVLEPGQGHSHKH